MSSAVAPATQQAPAALQATPPVTESIRELRGWLMVLATVIASITYASGLSPPGGFERVKTPLLDDPKRPPAASETQMLPSLYLVSPARCRVFYYANTAALALSLSLILLLGSQDLRRLARVKALEILIALDVVALLVAYLAGAGSFGDLQLVVCAGVVLVVPLVLVAMSSRLCGKYFWDEL
ncbi:unnamed protein product [Triticum aestivum]|uniref:PGG domain-containing protein n=4 Tax=Triticinae TaxID=1648030 RepID=A0A9R1ELN6_WHEAT|nr:hypothetical protein CFC21_026953 [Triticum aestivum]SPT15417.1 unnamed protein product [Triticum aestivum]